MEMDFTKPLVNFWTKRIMTIVNNDNIMLCAVGSLTLSPIFPIATPTRLKPITVMTDPVTIGGKKRAILEKIPATKMT